VSGNKYRDLYGWLFFPEISPVMVSYVQTL